MKKKMILMTVFFAAGLIAFGISYYFTGVPVLFTFAITFGTCLYHFGIRLIVGHGIDAIYRNKMNYNRWWFRERKHEAGFYKFLHVQKWKKIMPTYTSDAYDVKKHSLEEIVQVTCQSEVVHEINMVLSFVPIIFTIWFGSFVAFLVTSIAAFIFDSIFVIMQRYNRPRLRRIMELQAKRAERRALAQQ